MKAFVNTFRFEGSKPKDIPLVSLGDIVITGALSLPHRLIFTFDIEDSSSENPYVVTLKIPRTEGKMPRSHLREVPEPKASEYLRAFEDFAGLAQLVQEGKTSLLLFDLVGGIYRHKPDHFPLPEPLVTPDGRLLTRSCSVLGAGAFGVTFRVEDTRDHSDTVLKATRPPESIEERDFFHNEHYIASAVNHPNVLPASGPSIEAQLEPGGGVLCCLLSPFCEGGDLDGVIRRHLRSPSDADGQERWLLLGDMVRGLAHLHGKPFSINDHRVLHNDIKPANVLLRRQLDAVVTKTERPMALLADLGLACVYTGGTLVPGRLLRGTPGFMAPELRVMPPVGLRPGNTPATDVYSMGVTLYCLYSQTDTVHKTEERPTEDELREAFAELAKERAGLVDLLVGMCSENPTARPTMDRILSAIEPAEAAAADEAHCTAAAEAETRHKASAAAARKASEEEARRRAAEEAARRRAAEEAARRMAEEEAARRKAEEEEARRRAAEEAAVLKLGTREGTEQLKFVGKSMTDQKVAILARWLRAGQRGVKWIGDEGACALATLLTSPNCALTHLIIHYNMIGDEGARALAAGLAQSRTLQALRMDHNQIGDEGARALAEALPRNSSLHELWLNDNQIGDAGACALAAALPRTIVFHKITLEGNPMVGRQGLTAFVPVTRSRPTIDVPRETSGSLFYPVQRVESLQLCRKRDRDNVFNSTLTKFWDSVTNLCVLPIFPAHVLFLQSVMVCSALGFAMFHLARVSYRLGCRNTQQSLDSLRAGSPRISWVSGARPADPQALVELCQAMPALTHLQANLATFRLAGRGGAGDDNQPARMVLRLPGHVASLDLSMVDAARPFDVVLEAPGLRSFTTIPLLGGSPLRLLRIEECPLLEAAPLLVFLRQRGTHLIEVIIDVPESCVDVWPQLTAALGVLPRLTSLELRGPHPPDLTLACPTLRILRSYKQFLRSLVLDCPLLEELRAPLGPDMERFELVGEAPYLPQ
ncbi:hypothetical protein PAPYR_2542 [Paratrimastix pyriformis]|uniref:Protein kinase domain-containing protein n=1 Tax=Paratrimastix pyriformis TaxID=342808 RepID=A0ABQ8UPJ7_9EUKA|nr:hypothetical protein PAPYR_2542 [Paratrimastix pyriformis]